jgi:hypothetical protein
MPIGFYELLQVSADASADAVRAAYQDQVAQVVRKLRAAEARQQDVAAIEARRHALGEAWSVLSDPPRRRRYDRYRELSRTTLPVDPEDLWAKAGPSMIDPAAAAALAVLRTLTDLKVGEPILEVPPEPEVSPVQRLPRPEPRPELRVVPEPRPEPARPAEGATLVMPAPSISQLAMPAPSITPPTQPFLARMEIPREPAPRPAAAIAPGTTALSIDRNVAVEDLARLLDQNGPTGAFLKASRELRRTTLPQLSATTRVSLRFLDAMERDAYTDLPGATFVRGYLKMVVRALEAIPAGPEADEFVEGYMSRFHRARG